jgi:hypothetical protein
MHKLPKLEAKMCLIFHQKLNEGRMSMTFCNGEPSLWKVKRKRRCRRKRKRKNSQIPAFVNCSK